MQVQIQLALVDAMCVLVKCGELKAYIKSTDAQVTDALELTEYGDKTTIMNNLTGTASDRCSLNTIYSWK